MKKQILIMVEILIIIIAIVISYRLFIENTKTKTSTQEGRTIMECIALSKDVRINENTKNCFDNLSIDEFGSLIDSENKDALNLYNEIMAYYDTRTETQKQADGKANIEFFNKIEEANPEIFNN
ncbi:MAG: hypothetical protein AAB626_02255 [Patescibacteria group bacterium]